MIDQQKSAVSLSALTEADIQQVQVWKNDIVLARQIVANEQPVSFEEVRDWLTRSTADPGQVLLGIRLSSNDGLIGVARLMFIDMRHKTSEMGLYIGNPEARGQGFGKAAVRALVHYAFIELQLDRVFLKVLSSNHSAIRCYRACGFSEEGVWRDHVVIDGVRQDMTLMGLLKHEWVSV